MIFKAVVVDSFSAQVKFEMHPAVPHKYRHQYFQKEMAVGTVVDVYSSEGLGAARVLINAKSWGSGGFACVPSFYLKPFIEDEEL